ncbi:MAG: hypothetical protein F6K14_11125 [Symploca sp. SIO2C1]|nr:hypothetical protein [Symploca sp. SIO2C1]
MSRDAVVVGINTYSFERLSNLKAPSEDAEAVAQLLTKYGDFEVKRLPAVPDKQNNRIRVGRTSKSKVSLTMLEEALVELFKPEGENIPETALLYFSGHGLRKHRGIQEGYLATSDVNPDFNIWGLSLQWLRRLLEASPVQRQIIWLDCCYSGELLNFEEADPGNGGKERDRCFIAACREYKEAYEEVSGNHSIFTRALLQGLDPRQRTDGPVTNYTLVNFINQALKAAPQRPIYANFGGQIILTGRRVESNNLPLEGICPYKGLAYFDCNEEDPQYFYGRTTLTDQLVEQVRKGNFLAILGASGSGKSSVLRAGLIHQLKQGKSLSNSDSWPIYIISPNKHPLRSLAEAFVESELSTIDHASQLAKATELISTGAAGLGHLVTAAAGEGRVVLAVDQFEEVFTLCRDETERQQFFECLLGALEPTESKLCLVIAMRADFFGKCAEQEYAGLVSKIQEHLVTVTPMTQEELEQAITEPAKKVGLERVEPELVTQMLADVAGPGSLPLLQYTLTELWQQRTVNYLTLAEYIRLGGVQETLPNRAEEVYESLSEDEQLATKRIFLRLTQLGEGTEDTRRQVFKRDLVTPQQSEKLIDQVIQKLTDARLIVTNELRQRTEGNQTETVVDVAHEALIRHWIRLRQWVNENREALRIERKIEAAAQEWQGKGKLEEVAFLLQGPKLAEAESYLLDYSDLGLLSSLAQEFIQVSQAVRDRLIREEKERRERELEQSRKALKAEKKALKEAQRRTVAVSIALLILVMSGGFVFLRQRQFQTDFYDIWSDISPDIARDEKLEKTLHQLLKQADSHKQAADRNEQERDIERALAYYRKIRAEISKNLSSLNNKQELENLYKESESSLNYMIQTYRIPQLEQELKDAQINRKFGTLIKTSIPRDFERQYTEGPLKTTYAILMRELGAKADLNDDGLVFSKVEADQMPCETLKKIQELWRKYTENRCGFYDQQSSHLDRISSISIPACPELASATLTSLIFPPPYSYAIDRLNYCKIAPQNLLP